MIDPRKKITLKIIDAGGGCFDVQLFKGPGVAFHEVGVYNKQLPKYKRLQEIIEKYPREKNQAKRLMMLKDAPEVTMINHQHNVLTTKAIVNYLRRTYPLGK